MPALINDNETIEIRVYAVTPKGESRVEYHDSPVKEGESCEELVFVFKRPAWGETKEMMSQSVRLSDGKGELDPYRLMDARLKVLLKKWNLKSEDGKSIALTPANIERLPAPLVEAINAVLGQRLS